MLNSNLLKDQLSATLGRTEPGGARFRFPVWAPDFFYTQMCAEDRTSKGWESKSGRRNEAWDLSYYVIGLCLHPDISIEHLNWTRPPAWAEEFGKNALVNKTDAKHPLVQVTKKKIDLARIAAEVAQSIQQTVAQSCICGIYESLRNDRLSQFMAATTQLLADAELAYHRLVTGTAVVEVRDSNGETIKYAADKASLLRLATYIQGLKAELGMIVAGTGPMQVWF